jgi:hypothetical protein
MNKLIYLLLFFAISCYIYKANAQSIARQVMSSQGATQILETGQVISQTIGQTGMIGSFYSGKGIQGFQQPLYSKFAVLPAVLSSKLVVYPNPFVDVVQVNVPDVSNQTPFLLQIFDATGRLILSQNQFLSNNTLSISLGNLPNGSYILLVNSVSIKFSSVILKQ